MLTQTELKEILHYNPLTGVFTWVISRSNRVKVGDIAGTNSNGYVAVSIENKVYRAHRLAWFYTYNLWPNMIDHKDGIRHHNWLSNLRDVNNSENMQNVKIARKDNVSGLIGACFNKNSGKFTSELKINGKRKYLGSFDSAVDAHYAYLSAKRAYHPFNTL